MLPFCYEVPNINDLEVARACADTLIFQDAVCQQEHARRRNTGFQIAQL